MAGENAARPRSGLMTWGEFKAQVEKAGVTDEMGVAYIDVVPWASDPLSVEIQDEMNVRRQVVGKQFSIE